MSAVRVPVCGWAITAALAGACAISGCVAEQVAELVPVRCGLQRGALDRVRVRARGDFPPGRAASVEFPSGGGRLGDLPDGVVGLTVEGLFGDDVEAVGRTARFEREGELPVYFARPDRICAVPTSVPTREVGAIALLDAGPVLLLGGRDAQGLSDDVIAYSDADPRAALVENLPFPSVGQTAHQVAPDIAAVLGGAGFQSLPFVVELAATPDGAVRVGDPVALEWGGRPFEGRAHHAAVTSLDGRIFMTGGCTVSDDAGTCLVSPLHVRQDTFFVQRTGPQAYRVNSGPPLQHARFGHGLLQARDGVLFAVGGWDDHGWPVHAIEMLLPGAGSWTPYGPSLDEHVLGDVSILGSTLVDGGLVVVLLSTGELLWLDENGLSRFPGWCDGEGPCIAGRAGPPVPRHLLTLPGERVVVDTMIVGPALLGQTGREAVDMARPISGWVPPAARYGARTALLSDGTVLLAGGWALDGTPPEDWLVRLRPALDGPDERIPNLSALAEGALVLHDTGSAAAPAITMQGAALVIATQPDDRLMNWVHVRGFRSRSFRFEATFETQRDAKPFLVFPKGAVARVEVHFDEDAVRFRDRQADGTVATVVCGAEAVPFGGTARPLRVDVSADMVSVRVEGEVVAACPGIGSEPVAMGFGARGDGSLRATVLRLTRN